MFAMRVRKFLIVPFLLLSAVILYVGADIAPAGGAQPTNAGSVTVTDSAIIPTSVTILARGSVVWTNRGSRLHKIISSHGAFNDFELAPADAHRVLFLSPGVYPYTVDGVIKGAVVVLTGVPPVSASPGPSSTAGPPRHFWKGTLYATASYRTHVPCSPYAEHCVNGIIRGGPWTGTYDGTLILAEDSDGLITGQGRVSMSGCKLPGPFPPAKHISFEVRGVDKERRCRSRLSRAPTVQTGRPAALPTAWSKHLVGLPVLPSFRSRRRGLPRVRGMGGPSSPPLPPDLFLRPHLR
jgi:hypothetical protein